jgi:predicted dehydrogenase
MLALRYDPAIFAAWKAVRAGEAGRVRLITAQKSYKLGNRPEFYRRRSSYGGTIPWVGSHAVDWMLWFSGKEPLSVHACHSSMFNGDNGDMEVSALCHFALEDEVMGGISIDYFRPSEAASHGDDRIRVVGTEGIVEVRGGKATCVSDRHGGEIAIPPVNPGRIFDDFLASARGVGRALCDHEDGFRVTRACLLARMSADEGRTVNVPAQ